jgi:hypothetical protein
MLVPADNFPIGINLHISADTVRLQRLVKLDDVRQKAGFMVLHAGSRPSFIGASARLVTVMLPRPLPNYPDATAVVSRAGTATWATVWTAAGSLLCSLLAGTDVNTCGAFLTNANLKVGDEIVLDGVFWRTSN